MFDNVQPSKVEEEISKRILVDEIRKAYQLDHAKERHIFAVHQHLKNKITLIAQDMYAFILKNQKFYSFFENESHLERLQKINERHLLSRFTPPIDQKYINRSISVGVKHYFLTILPNYYVETLNHIRSQIKNHLDSSHHLAVDLVFDLEKYICLTAYYESEKLQFSIAKQQLTKLFGVVVHDMANPISIISGNTDILAQKEHLKEDKAFKQIVNSSDKLKELITIVKKHTYEY